MASPTFEFKTDSYQTEFTVISFKGNERISRLFRYVIGLKVPNPGDGSDPVNEVDILSDEATFILEHGSTIKKVHGVLSSFEEIDDTEQYIYYQAVLVPKLWNESLTVSNQIYKDKSVLDIIADELSDAGFESETDYLDLTTKTYPARDFTCQYGESNFQFISRLMEFAGIYYYFEHNDEISKLKLADDAAYPPIDNGVYQFERNPSGDAAWETISKFRLTTNKTTDSVMIRDYNLDQSDVNVQATEGELSAGVLNLVDENVIDSDEATAVAKMRLEEIQTDKNVFDGESGITSLNPGYTFELQGHRRTRFNTDYLVVGVIHEGKNLDNTASDDNSALASYKNTFRAVKSDIQFRPRQVTNRPKIYGTKSGVIYSEQNNPFEAEINPDGKYRVKLHYINSDQMDETSHWIPMAQPAAGTDDALFIPLKGGVTVLLTFIDGNPDRPVIQSALSSSNFLSPVTADNSNHALISASGLLALKSGGGYYKETETENYTTDLVHEFNEMDNSAVATDPSTPMTSAEEMSGEYILERVTGPQYHWFNGPSYTWDNQPCYEFGNGYTEIHQDINFVDADSSEINGEHDATTDDRINGKQEFDIPTSPDAVPDNFNELSDGLVEKVWGDKYEYHHGNAYSWAHNSTKAYSYGNGYTENLINTEAPTGGHDDEGGMDRNSTVIEKTYGDTYSYQHGKSREIHHGDSHEETYGNTNSTTHGRSDEKFMGGQSSFFLGGSWETNLAASNEIITGVKSEVFIGGKIELSLAAGLEVALGPVTEFCGAGKFSLKPVRADAEMTALKQKVSDIGLVTTKIGTFSLRLHASVSEIDSVQGARLENSAIGLDSSLTKIIG